jgi:NodT family efflux transporter outer membrane factor (OMF) lipoprotein
MRTILALAAAIALASCVVGPNYVKPTEPVSEGGRFVEGHVSPAVSEAPVEVEWWRLFDQPALDRLVAEALAHNTDVRIAAANLQRARAILSEARSARLPSTVTSASYSRERVQNIPTAGSGSGSAGTTTSDFFAVGFDASYEVDLFGGVTRSIQAARGDTAAAAAALDAARVAVAAETARSFAQACSFADQAAVARETTRLQDETVALTRRLFDAGRSSRLDYSQAVTLAEGARSTIPGLEAEHRAALYALAVLTGHPPSEVDTTAADCVITPRVKQVIPVGDGATLLRRRPDVRQAERKLAADTARIGVATADLFPKITLLGSAGLSAAHAGDLGRPSSFTYSFGPLISWSFPNLTAAAARLRQAKAQGNASLAAFDGTVLTALKEVEQALARYAGQLDRNASLVRAEAASADAANISRIRFQEGSDSFLTLLVAERARAQARAELASSNGDVADAQVSLFKALGGGWEDAPPVVLPVRPGEHAKDAERVQQDADWKPESAQP